MPVHTRLANSVKVKGEELRKERWGMPTLEQRAEEAPRQVRSEVEQSGSSRSCQMGAWGQSQRCEHGRWSRDTECHIVTNLPTCFIHLDPILSMAMTVQGGTQKSLTPLIFDLVQMSFHSPKAWK